MDITAGHWIYAVIATGLYIIYIIWSYKKEASIHKKFNFKAFPILLYSNIIILFIYFTS